MPRRSRPHHRKLRAVRRTAAAAAAVPPAVDLAAAAADVQEPPLQTGLQKRLHLLQLPQEAVLQTAADEKRFIDVKTLSHIGSLVRCSLCDHRCNTVIEEGNVDTVLKLICDSCEHVEFSTEPPGVLGINGEKSTVQEGILRMVFYTILSGVGYAGHLQCSGSLALPTITCRIYYTHANFLLRNMELFVEEMRSHVMTAMRKHYSALRDCDPTEPLSIDVSFDGTWMTRGYRSHIGAAFVMDCDTGFVIDYEILCNFCEVCIKKEKSLSPADFTAWKLTHKDCRKNYNGKSGSMETEAARRMWSRSETLGYRYITFVGDGDSSAFNAVKALNDGAGPYPDPVLKEECLNHVSKRLGTRLRNLKKDLRKPVTTKTGKIMQRSVLGGAGGMTDESIDKLTRHYGQNVRAHPPTGSAADLRTSILATFYHARSTEDDQHHSTCSPDWCWVRKAQAAGEVPAPHSTKKLYLSGLSPDLLIHVFRVYLDLTAPALLQRCMKKRTQNPNESLHSKLWKRCSKVKNSQLPRVQFAAADTVMIHNFGTARGSLLGRLGMSTQAWKEKSAAKDMSSPSGTPRPPKRRRTDGGTTQQQELLQIMFQVAIRLVSLP
jgi:hypothetical protein